MLLRLTLLTSTLCALILAADQTATPLFPNQDKSLEQLTRQALDNELRAAMSGQQAANPSPNPLTNPTRMPSPGFVRPPSAGPFRLGQAFPAITKDRVTCAIPLQEARVNDQDPIGKPVGKPDFDRMMRPTPLPACKTDNRP